MGESDNLGSLGSLILIIGILGLLIGITMPATSTYTSETCVDSYTGSGQDCVSSSVTTANPLKSSVVGAGLLAIVGAVVIFFMGSESSPKNPQNEPQRGTNGGFAEKLKDHQDKSDDDLKNRK